MSTPSRFLKSVHVEYPDDNSTKEVYLQAEGLTYSGVGDRHVLLCWLNGVTKDGSNVTQIVQLTGQAGNYSYFAPVAKIRSAESSKRNLFISLGKYTRAQRDQVLELAKNVKFEKKSTTNGCRVWTRDLLEAMAVAGLISQAYFADIDTKIPLVRRQSEA
jgi:hypothetical protein